MRFAILSSAALLPSVGLLLVATSAHAATYTVTSTDDTGVGTLRAAITDANANTGTAPHTINITATGTINLATALPAIQVATTITGPGAASLTIQRSGTSRYPVIQFSYVQGKISGVTIAKGETIDLLQGAGIDFQGNGQTFELVDSVVTGNNQGAAVSCDRAGTCSITRSRLTGNGGGYAVLMASAPTITLTETTIADNSGTAIVSDEAGAVLTVDRCTIANNTSRSGIGGLQLQGGSAVVKNSTFSGNIGAVGGDFWTYSDGVSLTLLNVTSVNSSSPAVVWDHAATVKARNTIFAGTGKRCALGKNVLTKGNNLATDDTCALTDPTDKPSTDPKLGDLADNGGPTQTHALLTGSPAQNAGSNTDLPATDQRGLARIAFGTADIGAFEVQEPVDAGSDAGPDTDAGGEDAGGDAAVADAGAHDAGGSPAPASAPTTADDGCGCVTAGRGARGEGALAFALVLGACLVRRKRRA